jgi:hypothetical protein
MILEDSMSENGLNQDGVNTAFSLILGEIENVIEELTAEGTQAFQQRHYDEANRLSRIGTEMGIFQEKVRELQRQWVDGFDTHTRDKTQVERMSRLSSDTKGSRTNLRIAFPNGRILRDSVAAQTFVRALEEFGIDRVKSLDLKVNRFPLVSCQKNEKYYQHKIGGHYIMTHSSTRQKKHTLEKIAKILNVQILVEIV